MAKRDVYVKQNLNRRYILGCVIIVLRNTHILRSTRKNTGKYLEIISQYNKLCFTQLAGNPIMHYTNNGSQQNGYQNIVYGNKATHQL